MRRSFKILIAILIAAVIAVILLAVRAGGKTDVSGPDSSYNISDSAVHDYRLVSLEDLNVSSDSDRSVDDAVSVDTERLTEEVTELDLWDMGLQWYGISYEDTNRTLRLITYEGYGGSLLSYYVACCCWVRATEGYWGYGNLYQAFGEADTSYDLWMDELGIADWAYPALWECYIDPTYCRYCNGMAEPSEYLYYENGIYVWN